MESNPVLSGQKIGEFMAHFYEAPRPDRISDLMHSASANGLLNDLQRAPGVFSFLGIVFTLYPDRLEEWLDVARTFPRQQWLLVLYAACLSEHPRRNEVLLRAADQTEKEISIIIRRMIDETPSLRESPVSGAGQLDLLWGAFFASGDVAYIERIMSVLTTPGNRDALAFATKQSAFWSLAANAKQHERVLAACREFVTRLDVPEEAQTELESWMRRMGIEVR